jgi:putative DNA primase/helicase
MSGAVMRLAKETVKRLARHVETLDDSHAGALLAHIKASLSTAKLKALVECAQSEPGMAVQPEDLDQHPWLLNVANGTLDLQTGTLRDHDRADLLTFALPVAYDARATCPTWQRFLDRIMAGNQNLIAFLQRAIGYALTGAIREHVLLILWGTGRNGKSTFLNTLRTLLGPYGMKAPSELLIKIVLGNCLLQRAEEKEVGLKGQQF